jgi:RimJ/RimL family protein N-acetyltransferase
MPHEQRNWQTLRLDTPRLCLCPLGEADVEDIFRLYSDEEVSKYLMRLPSPYSYDAAQRFITEAQADLARGSAYTLRMIERDTPVFIGVMTLRIPSNNPTLSDEERADDQGLGILGYSVVRPIWRQGFATEGAQRMIAFAFDVLGLARLQATALRANTSSRHILERLGFVIEEAGVWEEPLYGGPAQLAECYILRHAGE